LTALQAASFPRWPQPLLSLTVSPKIDMVRGMTTESHIGIAIIRCIIIAS
jgi:hypothetical protein